MTRNPQTASLNSRMRGLVDYSLKLTTSPADIALDDITALRNVGLSDSAIHDAAAVAAYFNFVNRTALGLGVELE